SKAGPGGNSLLNSFHSRGPAGESEGMLIFTWDAEAKGYKAFILAGDFAGALLENGQFDGDKLTLTGELPAGARKMKIRNVTSKPAPDSLVSEEYVAAPDGAERLIVKVEAKRRANTASAKSQERKTTMSQQGRVLGIGGVFFKSA